MYPNHIVSSEQGAELVGEQSIDAHIANDRRTNSCKSTRYAGWAAGVAFCESDRNIRQNRSSTDRRRRMRYGCAQRCAVPSSPSRRFCRSNQTTHLSGFAAPPSLPPRASLPFGCFLARTPDSVSTTIRRGLTLPLNSCRRRMGYSANDPRHRRFLEKQVKSLRFSGECPLARTRKHCDIREWPHTSAGPCRFDRCSDAGTNRTPLIPIAGSLSAFGVSMS